MSPELRLRIISGIVMAAGILIVTWLGGLSFRILAAAIGLLIFYEWAGLTGLAKDKFGFVFGWISLLLIALETAFRSIETAFILLIGLSLAALVINLFRKRGLWLPGGVVYAGLSAISLAGLRGNERDGLVTILFLFAVVWATDIFAYFVGRAVGGPKLAPRISPGKTWSGAIGGMFFAVIAGLGIIYFTGEALSLWLIPIITALSIASQTGDLFESWVKRKFGAKDSSHLIPGHGGVMDRVDGLVFACFLAFLSGIVLALASGSLWTSTGHLVTGV